MKSLLTKFALTGALILGVVGTYSVLNEVKFRIYTSHKLMHDNDSLKTELNNQERFYTDYIKKKFGCPCPPKIGLEKSPLKLVGSYDYNNDGNLDCVYQDSKTKKTYLYKSSDNGHGLSVIGEVNFPNNIQQIK